MEFRVTPAPHREPRTSITKTMRRVLLALIPAAIAYVAFFGWGLVINIVIGGCVALAAEAACLRLRRYPVGIHLRDGSALVTTVLLAFAMPPLAPWWLMTIGVLIAIVLAKQVYGGLGLNPFNPAMVAYVALLVSFPLQMTTWLPPMIGDLDYPHLGFLATLEYSLFGRLPPGLTLDAITGATPLDMLKTGLGGMQTIAEIRVSPLFGDFGGRGWEWINSFIGLGGLYLLYAGVIRWQIPTAMLGTLFGVATLMYVIDPSRFPSPVFHLFTGAAILGAFFIATDPVSGATTDRGRLIFGAGVGLLTYVIRTWGGYPDGVSFAVLLMNLCVPLIDRFTHPRVYGTKL